MLGDVVGFAENQEKATYGLGYELTFTKNSNNSVVNKANATNVAKIKNYGIEWFIPQYTTSISQ